MTSAAAGGERVLVIKLAALGDFIQAFGPFAAIRAHHPQAHITLLTTAPFGALATASPWFDQVWTDGRPAWRDLRAVGRLARRLANAGFTRVYDLQTSSRSSWYRLAVGKRSEWSGIARGASHPDRNPGRDALHTLERQRGQLEAAGIRVFPPPDLRWLGSDLSHLALPPRFALLLPGASPARPGKRWPAERYGELAARLHMPSVICGSAAEADLAATIQAVSPSAIALTGRTDLIQLGSIARRAALTVGNDSGPTHLAAAVGCPTLCLFGSESDPTLCAPRGPGVSFLQVDHLAGLDVDTVIERLGVL